MPSVRVVIVEDSAFVRKVVRQMLSQRPEIEVVGLANNGASGLEMVAELNPDVVTCDLNMPELDGVGFVREQMGRKPVPILILTAAPQDAGHALDALQAGAVDFLRKPTALANDDLLQIREELCDKVIAAARSRSGPLSLPKITAAPALPATIPARRAANFDVVVLGISTGGPQALRHLVPQLPKDLPVPFVIVLHMSVGYTSVFAERLAEISQLPVKEASDGCSIQPGEVLLAQAGRHLSFKRLPSGRVVGLLSVQPSEKPHRPSVDVLFQSAAEIYRHRVLGVVMTGMGEDGKQGSAWIKAQGGIVLTEAEESCIIYGMPRSVVESGLSDASIPLGSMAAEIVRRL